MTVTAPGPEARIYEPSELNQEARIHLEAGFPRLWIRGEISNLARPASGHLYFSLKDARAQIRCALFRSNAGGIGVKPQNGDQVLVRGRLSLYEPRGDYQLIADGLLAAGAGELQAAFEALKKKLEAEGLFAAERKKPLPAWPRRLAVVTSPSGAAVRDILHVLALRWPLLEVRIYPAQVQGEAAPAELIRALRAADRDGFGDVILLARGGGSLEDLWAFNDETLARTIAGLSTPIICGVGHETDFTIADFVADLRAPTPSAAAAAATPDGAELARRIETVRHRLKRGLTRALNQQAQSLDFLNRRLASLQPGRRLDRLTEQRAMLERRLFQALKRSLSVRQERLRSLQQRLGSVSPLQRLKSFGERRTQLERRLRLAAERNIDQARSRLIAAGRLLDGVSPLKVLERGYAVVRDPSGQALTEAEQFRPGAELRLLFRRFEVQAQVLGVPRAREPD